MKLREIFKNCRIRHCFSPWSPVLTEDRARQAVEVSASEDFRICRNCGFEEVRRDVCA